MQGHTGSDGCHRHHLAPSSGSDPPTRKDQPPHAPTWRMLSPPVLINALIRNLAVTHKEPVRAITFVAHSSTNTIPQQAPRLTSISPNPTLYPHGYFRRKFGDGDYRFRKYNDGHFLPCSRFSIYNNRGNPNVTARPGQVTSPDPNSSHTRYTPRYNSEESPNMR